MRRTPTRNDDPPEDPPQICDCCGQDVNSCFCPVCPHCGISGDIECYDFHGLNYSDAQLIGQTKTKIAILRDEIVGLEAYLAHLEDRNRTDVP